MSKNKEEQWPTITSDVGLDWILSGNPIIKLFNNMTITQLNEHHIPVTHQITHGQSLIYPALILNGL